MPICRPCLLIAIFILVMGGAIIGCASLGSLVPPVTDEMSRAATASGTDPASLNRGRDIYVNACARCHHMIGIDRHSAPQWDEILPRMSKLSKLTPQQTADLAAYVSAAAR